MYYNAYINEQWMPRYRQFKWWMKFKNDEPYEQNAIAIQIKHQDTLQAEVSYHSRGKTNNATNNFNKKNTNKKKKQKKQENKEEEEEEEEEEIKQQIKDPYNESHLCHSLRPIVGSSATGYSLSQTIAVAAGLSFHDVIMSDAHSYKTGKRENDQLLFQQIPKIDS